MASCKDKSLYIISSKLDLRYPISYFFPHRRKNQLEQNWLERKTRLVFVEFHIRPRRIPERFALPWPMLDTAAAVKGFIWDRQIQGLLGHPDYRTCLNAGRIFTKVPALDHTTLNLFRLLQPIG